MRSVMTNMALIIFFICHSFNCCLLPLSIISSLLRAEMKNRFLRILPNMFYVAYYLFTFTPLIKVKQAFFVEL